MARRARLFGRREAERPRLEVVTGFYDDLYADPSAIPDEPADQPEAPDEATDDHVPPLLEVVPELEPEAPAGPETNPHPFGDPGVMDEDGFSAEHSYAEKAEIERELLRTIEQRLAAAKAALDLNTADAMAAYAEDIRTRIARFESQMRDGGAGTP